MTISFIQALIIGILCYIASICSISGLTIGWYTLSKPLIAGVLIGAVLGDMKTGIIIGCAVQVVFIALVTPGGQMSSDMNFASYVGIPLGMVAVKTGGSVESAVAIATAVGALGTIVYNFMMMTNSIWNERAIHAAKNADHKGIFINHWVMPQICQFGYRAVVTTLCLTYGQNLATRLINTFTVDSVVMRTLTALGGMLPAVGVAILLGTVTKNNFDLLRFLFGFALVAALGLNMITVAIIGGFFAYSHFMYTGSKTVAAGDTFMQEDEEEL